MTTEEIQHMCQTGPGNIKINSKDPIWIQAFDEYNKGTNSNYNLSCKPCYFTVFNWHLNKSKL